MVRRVTASQFQSLVRQAAQKRRQAIANFNREVRAYNQKVNQRNQRIRQVVNDYNRAVDAHNSRVRANRQRLRAEIAHLNSQVVRTRYIAFRASVETVHEAYERLEQAADSRKYDPRYNEILDLSEQEAANNAGMMNSLLGEAPTEAPRSSLESPLVPILEAISGDLKDRWRGALFALSPDNPDAARHFCTSAREIITRLLNEKAPDELVAEVLPECERTQQGTPSRRSKIRYFLHMKGMNQEELEEFVERDMENVVQLFAEFNQGTHGSAGAFSAIQLQALRRRVEDGILFLSKVLS